MTNRNTYGGLGEKERLETDKSGSNNINLSGTLLTPPTLRGI